MNPTLRSPSAPRVRHIVAFGGKRPRREPAVRLPLLRAIIVMKIGSA
jgi:hypothetical protein